MSDKLNTSIPTDPMVARVLAQDNERQEVYRRKYNTPKAGSNTANVQP